MIMKKMIALLLALSLCVLCAACGGSEEAPTTTATAPATTQEVPVATTVPATEPEETIPEVTYDPSLVYTNPLTGEVVDTPITTRPVVTSISNIPDSLPHRGVNEADIIFESFVNGSIVRCLALYADITAAESIGSIRSARPILIDIAKHYNAFYAHAGGSEFTNKLMYNSGIDQMNVDNADDAGYAFRDRDVRKTYDWEHTLFVRGAELMEHITGVKKINMNQEADHSFGLQFAEDGTPADGETANEITITLKYNANVKETVMVYNAETGKYEYNQYGKTMCDEITGEVESFRNVIVMYTKMSYDEGYHIADFTAGGTGYYACGGKIIPITWKCAGDDQPFTYYTEEGEPLTLGVGNSYIALTTNGADVTAE